MSLEDKVNAANAEREAEVAARQTEREQKAVGYILGDSLHEQWRETRLQDDGTYAPRWKGVEDKALNDKTPEEAVAMGRRADDVVDIANTSFADLPEKWKGENLAAGQFAAQYYAEVKKAIETGEPISEERREEIGAEIHKAWSERNSWDDLAKVDYADLPRDEQLKDLAHLDKLQEVAQGIKDGIINIAAEEKKYGLDTKPIAKEEID